MADDFSSLARDIDEVPKTTAPFMRKAVEVTARNIKDAWRDKLTGSERLPFLGSTVSYDVTGGQAIRAAAIEAEIGIDKSRYSGPLGNISEFGTPRTPGRGYGLAALVENADDLDKGIQRAIDDGLKAAGL